MKTIIKIQLVALFSLALLLTACEKEALQPSTTGHAGKNLVLPDKTASVETYPANFKTAPKEDFEFDLDFKKCRNGTATMEVLMPDFRGYMVVWEIDDQFFSRKHKIECVEGKVAKVTVVRVADNYQKTKKLLIHKIFTGITPDDAEPETDNTFDFEMIISQCFNSGTSAEIMTTLDGLSYAYLWEVDGKPAGHYRKIECACGQKATVRVTRLSDGEERTKQVPLQSCIGAE